MSVITNLVFGPSPQQSTSPQPTSSSGTTTTTSTEPSPTQGTSTSTPTQDAGKTKKADETSPSTGGTPTSPAQPATTPAFSPPPPAPRLSAETGFAVARAVESGAVAPEADVDATPKASERANQPFIVTDGSDVAIRVLQDTLREVETRRADDADRAEARRAEREDETRRETVASERGREQELDGPNRETFSARAPANRGLDFYRTAQEGAKADQGAVLDATT